MNNIDYWENIYNNNGESKNPYYIKQYKWTNIYFKKYILFCEYIVCEENSLFQKITYYLKNFFD